MVQQARLEQVIPFSGAGRIGKKTTFIIGGSLPAQQLAANQLFENLVERVNEGDCAQVDAVGKKPAFIAAKGDKAFSALVALTEKSHHRRRRQHSAGRKL